MWLERILKYKREELGHLKRRVTLADLRRKAADAEPARDSLAAVTPAGGLSEPFENPPTGPTEVSLKIIAEIKKASPSAGVILPKYDPVGIAMQFEENGAAALSLLTDRHFFQGDLSHLSAVKERVTLPVLRKDFVFDEYQIYEARAAGADAVLLIVRILDDFQLKDYQQMTQEIGMAALVEVHDAKEADRTLAAGAKLVGINNRDLDTLRVDLATTEQLSPKIPQEIVTVSESGISSRPDIDRLERTGVHCFLVGEALLRGGRYGERLRELLTR